MSGSSRFPGAARECERVRWLQEPSAPAKEQVRKKRTSRLSIATGPHTRGSRLLVYPVLGGKHSLLRTKSAVRPKHPVRSKLYRYAIIMLERRCALLDEELDEEDKGAPSPLWWRGQSGLGLGRSGSIPRRTFGACWLPPANSNPNLKDYELASIDLYLEHFALTPCANIATGLLNTRLALYWYRTVHDRTPLWPSCSMSRRSERGSTTPFLTSLRHA